MLYESAKTRDLGIKGIRDKQRQHNNRENLTTRITSLRRYRTGVERETALLLPEILDKY